MKVGVSGFQPSRLAQIREYAGLTKTAIAEAIGVSPATLSKWESGQQLPTMEKLRALSFFFGVQDRFFLKSIPQLPERTAFFRSMANATKLARQTARVKLDWIAEISSFLEKWVDWPEVRVPNVSGMGFLSLGDSDIEKIAMDARLQMKLGDGPIQDVVLAMESSGIICAADFLGYSNMDGVSLWSPLTDRPYAFIGRDKANAIRNRFDAAHELGHIVLHRGIDKSTFRKYYREIERQADYFAGAFLMPAESFSVDINWPTLDTLLNLKRRWKVSVAAMIMRCYQLSIIDDFDKVRLFKGRSARGWVKGEPMDDQFPFESPKLLSRAFIMVHKNGLSSKEETLHSIGLPAREVERLSSLQNGYFSEPDFFARASVRLKESQENNVVDFSSYK